MTTGAFLWRYVDLSKFIAMISKKEIWFSRLDLLGDPFEGALLDSDKEAFWPLADAFHVLDDFKGNKEDIHDELLNDQSKRNEPERRKIFVSCWHENEHESAAMWKLYLKSDEGVAIRTTRTALEMCVAQSGMTVEVCNVKYVNFSTYHRQPGDQRILLKRKSFEHEREVRAIVVNEPACDSFGLPLPINCPLAEVIHGVCVAPGSPDFLLKAVQELCDKFDLARTVGRSAMDAKALY